MHTIYKRLSIDYHCITNSRVVRDWISGGFWRKNFFVVLLPVKTYYKYVKKKKKISFSFKKILDDKYFALFSQNQHLGYMVPFRLHL